jgi:hypothetical protein
MESRRASLAWLAGRRGFSTPFSARRPMLPTSFIKVADPGRFRAGKFRIAILPA